MNMVPYVHTGLNTLGVQHLTQYHCLMSLLSFVLNSLVSLYTKNMQDSPVTEPTQKFKTPLSSREASWNDNPDDSENIHTVNQT